jgi:urea transport system substrate-binding protein
MRTPRKSWLYAAAVSMALCATAGAQAFAQDTIKIGILHSLSGTMAISETILKDLMLMQVAELNAKGGLLGKKVEAVVVDPASNWPLFAEKARELLSKDKVSAVFGCWTSVSRKSVLPVFEELNGLLFYPLEYEGEEASYNIFYGSSVPDNKAIPAVEYLMSADGGEVKRFVLEGTDYVYPRTSNKIIRAFLKSKGVKDEDIMENYTPFGFADWQTEVAAIKKFGSAGKKTAVVSTINGDANVPFYKELGNQGIKASDIPVIAFSVGEEELAGIDTKPLVGHLAAWSYFQSVNTPENKLFIEKWRAYSKNPKRVTNDPMESAYILFNMWVQAVQQAGTTDVDAVRQAMTGQKVKSPSGVDVVMGSNHHMAKPVMIGEIQGDGQFSIVYQRNHSHPKPGAPTWKQIKGAWPTGHGPGSAAAAPRRATPRHLSPSEPTPLGSSSPGLTGSPRACVRGAPPRRSRSGMALCVPKRDARAKPAHDELIGFRFLTESYECATSHHPSRLRGAWQTCTISNFSRQTRLQKRARSAFVSFSKKPRTPWLTKVFLDCHSGPSLSGPGSRSATSPTTSQPRMICSSNSQDIFSTAGRIVSGAIYPPTSPARRRSSCTRSDT